MLGTTRSITVPVRLAHLPGKLGTRGGPIKDGDLLLLRCNFSIKRSDYNIGSLLQFNKVANTIELRVALAGGAPK